MWRTLSASRSGLHEGGERVKDSILQLMKTVVQVPTKDRKGNPATEVVQILSDTTATDDDENPVGEVVYSFSTGRSTKNKKGATSGRC